MRVFCDECDLHYDDTYRLTYCPHDGFNMVTLAVRGVGQTKVCRSIEELDAWMGRSVCPLR